MKNAPNFRIEEFVPQKFFKEMGVLSIRGINEKLPAILQYLKNHFNGDPVTVNNWLWGGIFNESGLRTVDHKAYNERSGHARGDCVDAKFKNTREREVADFILQNQEIFIPLGVTGIEINTWGSDGNGWVHISCENFGADGIVIMDAANNGSIVNWEVFKNA